MTRIDKYLWSIRVFKTRSLASSEIKKGKVDINGQTAKPSSTIRIGDKLDIRKDGIVYSFKVLNILEKRIGAKLVADYALDITNPEEMEKKQQLQIMHQSYRQSLLGGKPSKKDKRDLKKFLGE